MPFLVGPCRHEVCYVQCWPSVRIGKAHNFESAVLPWGYSRSEIILKRRVGGTSGAGVVELVIVGGAASVRAWRSWCLALAP